MWAAGIQPAPLTVATGLPLGAGGRVEVGGDLRLAEHPEVFVIGDIAAARNRHGELYLQMASVALQQGHHVGRQIGRLVAGRGSRPFHYIDYGTMATIGRNAAVAELAFHIRLRGAPGWYAWLLVHLVRLMGFRNRLSVFFNWAWNYFTYDRSARLILDLGKPASRRGPGSGTGTHLPP